MATSTQSLSAFTDLSPTCRYLEAFLSDPQASTRPISPVWLLSGTLKSSAAAGTNGASANGNSTLNGTGSTDDGKHEDDMDVDNTQQADAVQRRTVQLVSAAELQGTLPCTTPA